MNRNSTLCVREGCQENREGPVSNDHTYVRQHEWSMPVEASVIHFYDATIPHCVLYCSVFGGIKNGLSEPCHA